MTLMLTLALSKAAPVMIKGLATASLALFLLATAADAADETCATASPKASGTTAEKGPPATVGTDGVGGTGWTGGTGGLMAGTENEKAGQNPDTHNPNVAKGLDPTKGVTPGDKGPGSGPKPPC